MKLEKVYVVRFMKYTNATEDTVSDWDEAKDPLHLETSNYLEVGRGPFLVKESDLLKYQKFGGGYNSIRFVGNIEVDEQSKEFQKVLETSELADVHSTVYDPIKESTYKVIVTCQLSEHLIMLMASELINLLVDHISKFGDSPCVMEHFASDKSGAVVEPINNVASLIITQVGSDHFENCVVFLKRNFADIAEWFGGSDE